MNTENQNPTPPPKRKREGLRYETCRECGKEWNVSKCAVIPKNAYLCPRCWGKNQKMK